MSCSIAELRGRVNTEEYCSLRLIKSWTTSRTNNALAKLLMHVSSLTLRAQQRSIQPPGPWRKHSIHREAETAENSSRSICRTVFDAPHTKSHTCWDSPASTLQACRATTKFDPSTELSFKSLVAHGFSCGLPAQLLLPLLPTDKPDHGFSFVQQRVQLTES